MEGSESTGAVVRPGKGERHSRLRIAAVVLWSLALILGFVAPASAGGAMQISGNGRYAELGECVDPVTGPEGQYPDFASVLTEDLEGCLYVFIETVECRPGGAYIETGTEVFVGEIFGGAGTFMTSYRFTAKFQDCATLSGQINGRGQHPILAGTGTETFWGVAGRLDFKDDIATGTFPYNGYLQW